MKNSNLVSRRIAVKSSLFGLIAVSIPNLIFAKEGELLPTGLPTVTHDRYPAIEDKVVAEVVGVSHFDLDRLKVLVNERPELARATWDWGFGDWETAIGAASHVGRKDIIEFLMLNGARPDIFTYASLGSYETVKSMIGATRNVQQIAGPHGISLAQHVRNGMENNTNNTKEAGLLLSYLESLGDADGKKYISYDEMAKDKYIGDYKYGNGAADGFSVKLNRRKLLTLGKLGKNGGALYKIGDNKYMYNGAPSVNVSFLLENEVVTGLTVTEPNLSLTAKRI